MIAIPVLPDYCTQLYYEAFLILLLESLKLLIPKFRKQRRQVKSVDAIKSPLVQNSYEFSKQLQESSGTLYHQRANDKAYNQYQSPKLFVLSPGTFLRRNNSEQKGQFLLAPRDGQGYHKPLSLMSSMK